jgi:hypothetical protein
MLCSELPEEIESSKDFDRDKMLIISDDFVLKNFDLIKKVKMYNPALKEDILGLEYHGITIIDNTAAQHLKNELETYCVGKLSMKRGGVDAMNLVNLLSVALKEKKYIIHFGI